MLKNKQSAIRNTWQYPPSPHPHPLRRSHVNQRVPLSLHEGVYQLMYNANELELVVCTKGGNKYFHLS